MNLKLIITTILVLCLAFAPAIADKGTDNVTIIKGKVVNPDGNPVAGAHVEIIETGQHIHTDSKGNFSLQLGVNQKFTLRAYTDKYSEIFSETMRALMQTDEIITLKFVQERSFSETIVITGTRQETLISDVPVRTEVITSELIEQKQAVNLADAIDGLSGLRVENNCQNCGFNQLRINGLEGGYSRIAVDGMSAFSSMTGVYGLEQIPSVLIDRVEVVKGGGSVLYGAGAVGGVVNVITKKPTSTMFNLQSSLASVDGEMAGVARGYGSWASQSGSTSVLAYGSIDKANEYDRNDDGFSDLGRKQLEAGGAKLFQSLLNDTATFNIGFDASHEWRRGGADIDLLPEETILTEYGNTLLRSLHLNATHYFTSDTYYQIQVSHAWNERETYYGAYFDDKAYGETDNPHTTVNTSLFHTLEQHSLSVGVQYERDKIDDFHPGYDFRTLQEYDVYGLFAQDNYDVTDTFTVLVGLRVDNHSALEDQVFSPRISAMLHLSDSVRLRASYAYGFKAPVVFDEDLHITIANGEPTFITNEEGLKEEKVNSYSVSLDWTGQKEGSSWRLETNVFYSNLDDTFVLDDRVGDNANYFTRINGGGSSVYGLEFTTDLSWHSWRLNGSFTAQRTELDEPDPDFGATRFFKAPDYYGNLNLIYVGQSFSLGTSYNYTGSMLAPHFAGYIAEDVLEESEDFHVIDLRLEVPLTMNQLPVSLIVMAKNITDDFQEDFDLGPDRDAGYVYGPRQPRSISLGAKVVF